jgi:hypothetical protein
MHAYRKDNTASEMYDKDIFLMQVWILNMILKLINNFFVCLHGDKTYNSFVCGNTT